MQSFEVQSSELPQEYAVNEPVSYSYSRYASRSYRFHPYQGSPSRQDTANLPFLKQAPPNAVVIPATEASARLTQLPLTIHHINGTRHTQALAGIQQAHPVDGIQHPNPTGHVGPPVALQHSQPVEAIRQAQDDAVVYDYYVRKERRSSAPSESQRQGATTENGRQRSRHSQFISVIKMPTKADMTDGKPNDDKTKDVVLKEFASSLLNDWKDTCDASTQTEDPPIYPPPPTSPVEPLKLDQTGLRPSVCTVECQTDQPPEEKPQLTPLVTPPLYGIDPKTGKAVSVVFHFRLPKQNVNTAMMEAVPANTATEQ